MLNLDSKYYYKATNFVESFSLRKLNMKPLMDSYPEIRDQTLAYFLQFYNLVILQPMQTFKKEIAAEVCRRQDVPAILRACEKEIDDGKKYYKEEMEKVTKKKTEEVQLTQQEQVLKIVKSLEE